jgi:hypothetical protein
MGREDVNGGLRENLTGADAPTEAENEVWISLGVRAKEAFRPECERVRVHFRIIRETPVVGSTRNRDGEISLPTTCSG